MAVQVVADGGCRPETIGTYRRVLRHSLRDLSGAVLTCPGLLTSSKNRPYVLSPQGVIASLRRVSGEHMCRSRTLGETLVPAMYRLIWDNPEPQRHHSHVDRPSAASVPGGVVYLEAIVEREPGLGGEEAPPSDESHR
jgi:hypothetical protein